MRILFVFLSVIAVLALGAAGYFYRQNTRLAAEVQQLQDRQSQLEGQLQKAQEDYAAGIKSIGVTNDVLKGSLASFLVPGDLKAGMVGAREAEIVLENIGKVTDTTDKLLFERGWKDFQASLGINDYLAFVRALANNIERDLENMH